MVTDSKIKASLFVTCIVDQLFPEVGVSVVRLLRRLGVEVTFPPDQTCCGQALFNSGFTKQAKHLARRVLTSFGTSGMPAQEGYVVVPSGSCASMMRIFYSDLFRHDPQLHQQANYLKDRVYEFSEFLVKILGVTDVGAAFEGTVSYHPSCHLLRELGVSQEPKALLTHVNRVGTGGDGKCRDMLRILAAPSL